MTTAVKPKKKIRSIQSPTSGKSLSDDIYASTLKHGARYYKLPFLISQCASIMPAGQTPGSNEDELQATYAGAKRRIAALELQIQNYADAGNKRKSYVLMRLLFFLDTHLVLATLQRVLPRAGCCAV